MTLLIVVLFVPGSVLAGMVCLSIWYPRYNPRADKTRFPSVQRPEDCDAIAQGLIEQMSMKEKLNQLSGDLSTSRFSFRYAVGWRLGSGIPIIYSGRNRRLGIPPLAFSDGPRGVNVGKNKTCFPVTMARGASFDPELEHAVGVVMGAETRASGANYSGAVCVNLLRHPGWGRAQETYGEDSFHLGQMGLALTLGIQSQNVMACVKHFALNSIENARFYVDVQVDERALREVYLPHFKKIVQRGQVASVMSAYNKFRGEYCGHSSYLLTRILRDEWDFRGFVTSDWMHGVRDGVAGFKAGMDVEMPAKRRYGRPLREGLKRGLLTEEKVNERVHRILRTRLWFALAPDPQPYEQSMCAAPSHIELARRVAEESMVLLRNEGDLLPLHAEKTKHIGVFGRLATVENTGDRGSSAVRAPYVVTPLEGIEARMTREGGVVSYRETFDSEQDRNWVQSLDAAILIVGLSHLDEGEWFVLNPDQKENAYRPSFFGGGGDRTRLSLHDADESLIRGIADVQPNTIVVCVAGSVVTMPWREKVSSIVFGFYSGMEGGHALANLLFGTVNPSGKLPFTIPESETHLPPFEPFAEQAHYGRYHGYRLYDTQRLPVAFPFGYGLSYTRFTVGNLVVEKTDEDWIVRVDVSNVGEMRGAEVLQVYLSFPDASVEQPDRKLVAFQKVWLEPKAKRSVALRIERAERGHFDVEQMDWIFPDEPVIVWVGTSSRDEVASYTVDKKTPQVQNPRAE